MTQSKIIYIIVGHKHLFWPINSSPEKLYCTLLSLVELSVLPQDNKVQRHYYYNIVSIPSVNWIFRIQNAC